MTQVSLRLLCAVLGFEATGFHAVPAELHVAPAAGVVFAGVEKEPAALRVVTGAQALHGLSREKLECRLCEEPEGKLSVGLRTGPA